MKPTVCRIVNYYPAEGESIWPGPLAGLVTAVPAHDPAAGEDPCAVALRVITPHKSDDYDVVAAFSTEPAPGCWTWPPRVVDVARALAEVRTPTTL